jgi:flagellar biogenesis protein FliO
MLLQIDVDPVLVGLVLLLLLVVFFLFLFVRRIITGFTDGLREGRQR